MSHWEKAQGQTTDRLEELCPEAALGTPQEELEEV